MVQRAVRCLVVRISPLLRRGCHALGYIQMSLSYYCRGREHEVGDGKDEKDSSDGLVLTHLREFDVL